MSLLSMEKLICFSFGKHKSKSVYFS